MTHFERGLSSFLVKTHHALILNHKILWSLSLLISLAIAVASLSAQQSATGPLGDYGDAPDELSAGYVHADPQRIGSFPSIFLAPVDASYILHRFPQERVYLGQTVTVEENALLVDRDLDDGWVPGSFLTCSLAQLSVHVTIPRDATAGPIYLNILFDWDHNGRWADSSTCSTQRDQQAADEWAIRNLPLHQQPYSLTPGFSGTIDLPEIITGPLEGELWVRVTITTEPVDERVFVPVAFGGHGWNGEGDFLYGETEDYFSCLLTSSDRPFAGCPRPLTDQPPIDPPPSTNQNSAPIANDDTAALSEGASAVIEVLSNDSDPDNDPFSIVGITQPAHGSVTINANGTLTYIPNPSFFGTDSFIYTICDTSGLCDTATVTITVKAANDPPVANDDTVTTDEDSSITIDVLANDTDTDSLLDPSTVTILTGPANGSVTVNPDGSVTYTPALDFYGTDTFTYQVCDNGSPVLCDTAIVHLTINAVRDAPIANDDASTTNEDTPRTINVLSNDTDIDGDPLSITSNTQASNGTVTCTTTQCTYTPNPNFNGTDTYTYTVSDGHGGTSTATVTVTVNPVNDPPSLTNIPNQTVSEGQTLTLQVSCSDVDGPSLTLIASNLPAGATFTDHGNGRGTSSYSPSFNAVQHPAISQTFSGVQITCSDGSLTDTKTFSITVHDVNRAPTLTILGDQTVAEGSNITLIDFAQCSDLDGDPLILMATGLPGFAGFSDSHDGTGDLSLSPDFSSSRTYSGNQISCSDGSLTDIKSFTISVTEINRAPEAFPQSMTTQEDTPVGITLTGSDPDGDPITFSLMSSPNNGTLSGFNPNTGTVNYTPNENYNGPDSFTFRVNDGQADSNAATVSITVTPVNDPPVANSQSVTTPEDTPKSITLSCTDIDSNPLTFIIVGVPTNGALSGTPPNVTYTPNANFDGSESLTFKCNDGQLDSNVATVSITVSPINDPPQLTAIPDQTVSEGQTLRVNVSCTDIDSSALALSAANLPPGAVFTGNGNGAGTLSYTPGFGVVAHPATSTAFIGVQLTCSDGDGGSDTGTFNIIVNDVNRNPIGNNDTVSTDEDRSVIIAVLANDSDPDGDPTSITSNSQGASGTVICTLTSCTYTPNLNFNGRDSFTYTISDGHGGTAAATVTITVNSINDAPVAEANGPYSCTVSGSVVLSSAGSYDVDGTIVAYQWDLDNNGSFETAGQSPTFNCTTAGTLVVQLQVVDNDGAIAVDTAIVTVNGTDGDWDKSSLQFVQEGKSCNAGGTVWATVENKGATMAGPATWELWYSSSGNPKNSGTLVSTGIIPPLDNGARFTIEAPAKKAGDYIFKAYQRLGHPGKGELWSNAISFDPQGC